MTWQPPDHACSPLIDFLLRYGLRYNVPDAGGIVAINVPTPGQVAIRVKVHASCCSRPTCRFCYYNIN